MHDLIAADGAALPVMDLVRLDDDIERFFGNALSANTRRAYRSDLACWRAWCRAAGAAALPADPMMLARYVAWLSADGRAFATIERRVATIASMHEQAGHDRPTASRRWREFWRGFRRSVGIRQKKAVPLVVGDLRRLLDTCGDDPAGDRDRALLLMGFAGALRRSEIVALDFDDVEVTVDGLKVTIRQSKTDQYREGHVLGIARGSNPETCPVRCYETWRERVRQDGDTVGSVFRRLSRGGGMREARLTDQAVVRILRRRAALAGFDPGLFSGHSLRSGFLTEAALRNVSDEEAMTQSRHKSHAVYRVYVRRATVFQRNASGKVGL